MKKISPQFRKVTVSGLMSVRTRLVVLALILVVPFMADRVRVLENSRASQSRSISAELAGLASRSATAQREMMSSIEALLRTVAFSYGAGIDSGRSCPSLRASLNVELPWINSLSVATADGKILCSTLPNYAGLNLSDRRYFQGALEDRRFVVSNYLVSKVNGLPALLAAYAAPAAEGIPDVVVVAGVNLKWMTQLMGGLRDRPGVVASVVDGAGVVLATQTDEADNIGQRLQDSQLLRMIASEETGSTLITTSAGTQRALSFSRIPGTDVKLVVSVDESKALRAIDSDIHKAYAELALVTILVLFGAWFVGDRLIMQPIRRLTSMTTRLGTGDLSARSSHDSLPPEFTKLATALNVMASRLFERECELRASNNRLTVLASVDTVSELANRRGFDSRLAFECARAEHDGQPLALMMIDIDHFKLFNDTYGHPEGDACLRRVGGALQAIASEINGFAARYGGEEFCLLVPNAGPERAIEIAEKVRGSIERMDIANAGADLGYVTVSIGIASVGPQSQIDSGALVEAADAGLYAAKRRGRNIVVEHSAIRSLEWLPAAS